MAGGCATDFYEGCRSNASLRRLRFLLLSIPQGCRWKNVAQISNLRYRRFVIGRTLLAGGRWQVENLRYSAARRGLSQRRSGTGVSPVCIKCDWRTRNSRAGLPCHCLSPAQHHDQAVFRPQGNQRVEVYERSPLHHCQLRVHCLENRADILIGRVLPHQRLRSFATFPNPVHPASLRVNLVVVFRVKQITRGVFCQVIVNHMTAHDEERSGHLCYRLLRCGRARQILSVL
jgi:hypothetical protein